MSAARQIGIVPMLFALFDSTGGIDRDAMRRQIRACILAGADGLAVLGLATEVGKLTMAERLMLLELTAEENAGRLPLVATLAGPVVADQRKQLRQAARLGFAWAIVQPTIAPGTSENDIADFVAAVADDAPMPIGIQNAPEYLGGGLSARTLTALYRRYPALRLIKAEGSALSVAAMIDELGRDFSFVAGRGGLEMLDNLRAGCAGIIPSPELIDRTVDVHRRYRSGDHDGAEAAYRDILPTIVFQMQSLENFLTYGKYLATLRLGLPFHRREPCLRPTAFGLAVVERHFARLGRLPEAASVSL